MRANAFLAIGAVSLVLSGCWTFCETDYPSVSVAPAGASSKKATVSVIGFQALVTEYQSVYGYSTIYTPGYIGRRHYRFGAYETVTTHTVIPQVRQTDQFRQRAQELVEDAGFVLSSEKPDRTIEVQFGGPTVTSGDVWREVGWTVLSAFLCDYAAATWTAKLRIRDNRTGTVLFKHTYEQTFETHVFGLVPILSVAACENTSPAFIQNWCLSALTDRAIADATAFLAKR